LCVLFVILVAPYAKQFGSNPCPDNYVTTT
jgi:hypothetical protein